MLLQQRQVPDGRRLDGKTRQRHGGCALLRHQSRDRAVNQESAEALLEKGIDISGGTPTAVTEEAQRAADVVVILGTNAQLEEVPGTRYERWEIGEPSLRDIHGMERMRLVRDEIDARVHRLYEELVGE